MKSLWPMFQVVLINSLISGYNVFRMKDGDCEVSKAFVPRSAGCGGEALEFYTAFMQESDGAERKTY